MIFFTKNFHLTDLISDLWGYKPTFKKFTLLKILFFPKWVFLTETRVLLVHGSKANKEEKRELINYVIHNIKPTDQTQAQSTVHNTVPFPALIPK